MSRDIERYLRIQRAYGASVGPEGRIAFLMDTTGTAQIWTLRSPLAWPRQRTFGDEPIAFAAFSPERPEIAFGRDEGGDEMTQLYRMDADGSHVRPWTEDPSTKHRWGGWSPSGDRIAYTANDRDRRVFDVHVADRDAGPGASERVLETDGWYGVADWSPDGDALALVESWSNVDQAVHVLDLETGRARRLTDDADERRYRSVNWVEDEELVLVADDGGDSLDLVSMAVEDGATTVLEDGDGREVTGVNVDRESGRMVVGVNDDGYTDLRTASLEPEGPVGFPDPELPRGVIGGSSFGPAGETVAVTVSGRAMNPNVYVIDVATGASQRWTEAATAGIPRSSFVEPDLVRYESFDGLAVPAFHAVPAETPDQGVPAVVDVHGGPESQRRPSFRAVNQYFLDNGYAVFEPNVRGSTGYGREYEALDDRRNRMDAVEDLAAGARWLAERPEIDPDRLIVRGGSYGGFMVLATLAKHPELWAAGIDVVGIANFVTFLENTGEWRRELREAEYGSLDEDRAFLERISPVTNADSIRSPLMVLHGANDPRVPVEEAEQIADAVEENGVPVEKLIFEDEGHGFGKRENRIEAYTAMVGFLDEHV